MDSFHIMMEIKFALATFIVLGFGFTPTRSISHHQMSEGHDESDIGENFRSLFHSIQMNDAKKTKTSLDVIQQEVKREQQAFDVMKGQLARLKGQKAHRQTTDEKSTASMSKRDAGQTRNKRGDKKTARKVTGLKQWTTQNSSTISTRRDSSETQSDYRIKPSDYLRIRSGVLGRDEGGQDRPIFLTVNTRDIDIFNVTDEDIKYLHGITDTAYYGLYDKKVTDLAYRNSKYTKTFDLSLNLHELQTRLGINEMVIKPYKLNLYTKGSFFKVHRDTHLPGLVATLILILPTTYTGGEIRFGDFYPERRMDKSKLRFIYFDIGVEHSISEVTSGHRISLVYNVLNPSQSSNKSTVDLHEMPNEVYQDLLREAIEFCKDKKNILLGHDKYRNDVFYKLLEDLKKQFKIIKVGVESRSYNPATHNVSDINKVYDVESVDEYKLEIEEHGGHDCHHFTKSGSGCRLKNMVTGKYKVEHKLFPVSTALRVDSMPHVPGIGNQPPGISDASVIEYYAGFLINPSDVAPVYDYLYGDSSSDTSDQSLD